MKKVLSVLMAMCLLFGLVGCGGARDEIVVAQREDGSGTRDAFESLFNCKNSVTGKLIYSSTGSLKTAVASDDMAIGYVSLGSVDNSVTSVKVDGVAASEENILNKTYIASRPFMMISKKGETLSAAAADFIKFIYSTNGQDVVHNAKIIKAQAEDGASGVAYDTPVNSIGASDAKVTVKLSGSTSMEEVVKALAEKYNEKQAYVQFSTDFMGSSAGKTDVLKTDASKADIGLVSSALSASDLQKFEGYKVATDGIAIVVNKKNTVSNLTKDQIVKIFKGEITHWSQVK